MSRKLAQSLAYTLFFCFLFCGLHTLVVSAQSPTTFSDLVGTWRVGAPASGLKDPTVHYTYVLLRADSTFISGIDSSQADPLERTSHGHWSLTADQEIRMVAESPYGTFVSYYAASTPTNYRYVATEENGKRKRDIVLETEIVMELITRR